MPSDLPAELPNHHGSAAEEAIPHASAATIEAVAELEHELVAERPVAIGALLVATTLLRIGTVAAGATVGFELTDMGVGARTIGLIGSLNAVSEFVFALILARYADRLGRTKFLIGGPLIGGVGVLFLWVAITDTQIGGARLLEGIAAAAFVPTALGTIAAATSHSNRARAGASSLFEAANLLGYGIGGLLGGFLYYYAGTKAFPILATFYCASSLVCAHWIPKVPPLPVSPLRTIVKAVIGRGPIRSFLPAWLAAFAMIGAFLVNLPPALKVGRRHYVAPVLGQSLSHHFDERVVVGLLTAGIVVFVIGIALWTPILARVGAARTMRRAIPGAWVLCIGLIVIDHNSLDIAFVFIPVLVIGVIVLAGFGPAAVTYLAECSETLAADRSALMAFYTFTLAAGGFVGALLGGIFADRFGIDGLAFIGTILSGLGFLALGRVVYYEKLLKAASHDD